MEMLLVRSTLPTEAAGVALARALIDARLAVCVHVAPMRSTYRWQGVVHDEAEWLLEARTDAAHHAEVVAAIRARHPDQVPLIETMTSTVEADYGAWAGSELAGGEA